MIPEDAQQTEGAYDIEVAHAAEHGNEREVEGEGGKEVNYAEEAERILFGTRVAIDAQDVFDGEEDREDIFHHGEDVLEQLVSSGACLYEGCYEAQRYGHHHRYVEGLSCWGVGLCYDSVQSWFVFEKIQYCFHVGMYVVCANDVR